MSDTPAKSRRGRVVAIVALVVLIGFLVWRQFFQTYHLVVVDPGKLYRDGNRSLREFKNTLRKTKPKTVIAVIDQQEFNEAEFVAARELVKSRGLNFHWIPIKAGAYPLPEQVREFLAIASDPANQPVLYHDDEGIRRAGMMMAAYQETVMGYDDDRAKAAMQTFGHSERTIKDVRRFIEAYDPVNGLTEDLNPTPATSQASTAPAGE
jgi:protein tyrosine/serine phosphatase